MARSAEDSAGADIQAIDRAAQILRLFNHERPTVRIADVVGELKVARTTAHRYLSSLAAAELLQRDEEGGYRLGPLLMRAGTLSLNRFRVVDVADPHLRELAERAMETSVLSVWGSRAPVIVRSYEPQGRELNVSIRVGREVTVDAAQSAVFFANRGPDPELEQSLEELEDAVRSRVLARIEQVRVSGLAVSDTYTLGVRSVAAPIFERQGRIAASIGITGTVHTLADDLGSPKVRALLETAERVSVELGYDGAYPRVLPGR